jgi:hypothetical protein
MQLRVGLTRETQERDALWCLEKRYSEDTVQTYFDICVYTK